MAWLLRLLLKTVLVLASLAAIGGGGLYAYHYWTIELPTSQVRAEARYAPYEPKHESGASNDAEVDHPIDLLAENSDELLRLRAKRAQEAARATFAEAQAHDLCLKGSPIQVRVLNGSRRTVELVKFHLIAKLPGRSTNLVEITLNPDTDRILRPHEEVVLCRRIPKLSFPASPASLEWSAQIDSVRFAD